MVYEGRLLCSKNSPLDHFLGFNYKVGPRSTGLIVKLNEMTTSWDTAPCDLFEVERRFRVLYCVHHQSDELITEIVRTSETSVYFKDTTRRYIQQGCNLHYCRRQNMKCDINDLVRRTQVT
jgi:hypothetical protein